MRAFVFQFVPDILTLHVPIIEALEVIVDIYPQSRIHIQHMQMCLRNGLSCAKVFLDAGILKPKEYTIVSAYEHSGNIAQGLFHIKNMNDAMRALIGTVVGALVYPAIVLSVACAFGVVAYSFVLPRVLEVTTSLHVPLPITTRTLRYVGDTIVHHVIEVVCGVTLVIVVVWALWFVVRSYTSVSIKIYGWVRRVLHIKSVYRYLYTIDIAHSFAVLDALLHAHMPVIEALAHTCEAAGWWTKTKDSLEHVRHATMHGYTLDHAWQQQKHNFPPGIIEALMVGSRTGGLTAAVHRIAEQYTHKKAQYIARCTAAIQPCALMLAAGCVGVIAHAVLVPLFSLSSHVSK
jgi:type II secretory pathway component PulF